MPLKQAPMKGLYDRSREKFEEGLDIFSGSVAELGDYETAQYYA